MNFKKLIITPHIHPNYPITEKEIQSGLKEVKKALGQKKINIELEAAAEYYVDEIFLKRAKRKDPFLSFGDRYILVESSFLNKPVFFEDALFELLSQQYKPILAHPERYQFLEGSTDWLMKLKEMGILFQTTLGSLSGYYGSEPKRLGMKLLKERHVDFLASDMHHIAHYEYLKKGLARKEVQNAIKSGYLKNDSLW